MRRRVGVRVPIPAPTPLGAEVPRGVSLCSEVIKGQIKELVRGSAVSASSCRGKGRFSPHPNLSRADAAAPVKCTSVRFSQPPLLCMRLMSQSPLSKPSPHRYQHKSAGPLFARQSGSDRSKQKNIWNRIRAKRFQCHSIHRLCMDSVMPNETSKHFS